VTDDHLALVHRAWRRVDKDKEFGGQEMFQIHVILFGTNQALDRVESVRYHLDPAYDDPLREEQNRASNFGFYELANGYSIIRAEVKVKDQAQLIRLSRFIDLMDSSPKLKGQYYATGKPDGGASLTSGSTRTG
jgi:hypothetical protein